LNKFDKILNLLQKVNLSAEEQEQLNSLVENDVEGKEFYNTYTKLHSALRSPHISYEALKDYILHKNNIVPDDKNIINRIPEIELHLKKCKRCIREFETLNQEYSELELFLSDKLSKEKSTVADKEEIVNIPPRSWKIPVYLFVSMIVLGFIYLSLFVASNIFTPTNYKLAILEDKSEFYITRGRASEEFQESLKALEYKDYTRAISHLEKDIDKNPNDPTIFYSHYILGLTYLESAEKNYAGLFTSFNEKDVKQGLDNFAQCIEKNTSGKFPDITYNAYFYSAKGSLILNDIESTKKYLKIVIEEKGSKMLEARKLLNELE
jgi:tetratricopeptide (TPR) repeat protein